MPGIAFVFFVVSAALFLWAVASVWRTHRVLARGIATYGTVAEAPGSGPQPQAGAQVIEYNVLSGEKARIVGSRGVRSGRFKVGDRVPLVFDPERADRHRVLDFRELWVVPIEVGLVAAAIAAVGLLVLP